MKVPYQLRRLASAEPATALFVPGSDAAELLHVIEALKLPTWPEVFAVADGFVVKLPTGRNREEAVTPRSLTVAARGAIRLRALAANLLLPVDAELVPALLPDEAEALVRQRGLLFLPQGRVLAYAADRPLPVGSLLRLVDVERGDARPLPQPTALADELVDISLAEPEGTPDDMLEAGRAEIGSEAPELPGASKPAQALGQALFQLGQGLAWLGQGLKLSGLAGAGARLLSAALALAPALSEKLMGAQEAALRDLLRDFRDGNIDKALRRALPLGGDPQRGLPAQNARLPTHRLFYSLLDLLGSGGPRSIWFTRPSDTYALLAAEYRKQAQSAAQRGDHRRAAFIYGRLLHDFSSAALVLAEGGLHRDAATIYEKKLNDPRSAARQWEAAGEIDRAVAIYERIGEYALAGDALRRAGEEERAVKEYELAAMALTGDQHFYEAGELLRTQARRPDLALEYYGTGWEVRQPGGAVPCVLRLVQHHAGRADTRSLLALADEAGPYVDEQGPDAAGSFYNELARLADSGSPMADELRDRALTGLARQLRTSGAPAWTPLFGGCTWPAPLLHDAQYALKQLRRSAPVTAPPRRLKANIVAVTAVCHVPMTGDVFLGGANGDVICYQGGDGSLLKVTGSTGHAVLSLAAHVAGTLLAVLREWDGESMLLTALDRGKQWGVATQRVIRGREKAWICSPATHLGLSDHLVLAVGGTLLYHRFPVLVCEETLTAGQLSDTVVAAFHVRRIESSQRDYLVCFHENGAVVARLLNVTFQGMEWGSPVTWQISWSPAVPDHTALQLPLLHIVREVEQLRITGIDSAGILRHSRLNLDGDERTVLRSFHPTMAPYRAFAVLQDEVLLAGVHEWGIEWWQPSQSRPRITSVRLQNPVAAVALSADEILVISADGNLTRIQRPSQR